MSDKAYMKEYRRKNRVKLNEHRKAWMKKNPGKHNEYTTRWRNKFPEKQKENSWLYVRKRQTAKLNAFVENIDRIVLLKLFKGRCGICQRPIAKGKTFHIDHIVPLSKGGEHSYENTQPAHPTCNLKKGAKKEVRAAERARASSKDSTEFRLAAPKRGNRSRRARPK